jgi:beta-galactosidase
MQLDDEPSYFQTLKGSPLLVDYNPIVVGNGRESGFYQGWLEKRYQRDLRALNDAHRAKYVAFADAVPPREALNRAEELPRFLDWYYCKLDMINEYTAHLYRWARGAGIEVPLSVLFPYLAQYYASDRLPRDLARQGLPVHITAECYPTGMSGVDHLAEDAIGHIVGNTEAYRTWWAEGVGPPVSAEAQCSMAAHLEWHGLEMYYTLLLAHGLNGFNFFMMVGGETPRGYELFLGPTFDLSSPIGPRGEIREHYWPIRRLGEWLRIHKTALEQTEPVSAIAYAYYPPYEPAGYGADTLATGLRDDYRDALLSYFGMEGAALGSLATLLPLAGADYAMLNLEYAGLEQLCKHKQVWVAGLDFMSRAVQQKLVEYVNQGGHLVLLPRVPQFDEHMHPLDGPLAHLFPAWPLHPQPGTRLGRSTPMHAVDIPEAGVDRALIFDYVDTFDLPGGAEAFAYESVSGKPCAYTVRSGAGKATLLGFKLRYFWDPQLSLKKLVGAVLALGGVSRPAYAHGFELIASLRRGEGKSFLFVANPSDVPQTAKIHFQDSEDRERVFPRRIEGVAFPRRGGLNLNVDADIPGTGARLLYCTSQIQAWEAVARGFRLKLYAHPGVVGEAAFLLPARPSLTAVGNAPPLSQEWDEEAKTVTIVYNHRDEYAELEVAYH